MVICISFWTILSTATQPTTSPSSCISTTTFNRIYLYLVMFYMIQKAIKLLYTHHLLFLMGGDSKLFEQLSSSLYLWYHAQHWLANVSITPSETTEYGSKGVSNVCLLCTHSQPSMKSGASVLTDTLNFPLFLMPTILWKLAFDHGSELGDKRLNSSVQWLQGDGEATATSSVNWCGGKSMTDQIKFQPKRFSIKGNIKAKWRLLQTKWTTTIQSCHD